MKTKKELIIEELEYCNESKLELIYDLLNLPQYCNKHDLIKFSEGNGICIANWDKHTPYDI